MNVNTSIYSMSTTLLSGASSVRNMKLQLAMSGTSSATSAVSSATNTATKTLNSEASSFLDSYRKNLEELKSAAKDVTDPKNTNKLTPGTDNSDVASATGALQKASDSYVLEVEQLASGQVNRSVAMSADSGLPTTGGSLSIQSEKGTFNISLSAGGYSSNSEMLKGYADKINALNAGVSASVAKNDDGTVSLEISGDNASAFSLSGSFAERMELDQVAEQGREAVFSLSKNGEAAQSYTSTTNNIDVDGVNVQLKGIGTTTISSGQNETDRVSEALGKMVDSFNKTLSFLNKNEDWGVGALKQVKRMVTLPTSEKSMEQIGITVNSDGSLNFDSDKFAAAMKTDSKNAMSVAERVASGIASDATSGLNESSYNLVGNAIDSYGSGGSNSLYGSDSGYDTEAISFLNSYNRNGVFNSVNMLAVGVLMNMSV